MKIMVSVGTHEQTFQRLLDEVARAGRLRSSDQWVVQYGVGSFPDDVPGVLTAERYFDAPSMRRHLEWADVLVSQASPGNVFGALDAGTWPIVAGRSRAAGEHVDDHQMRFARHLHLAGRATALTHPTSLLAALEAEDRRDPEERLAAVRTARASAIRNQRKFRDAVWGVLGCTP